MIPIRRRRARESAKGQWYDTKAHEVSAPAREHWGEETQAIDPMQIPFGKPSWNDEPQESVGEASPPEAAPASRFRDVRMETTGKRITLIKPKQAKDKKT